MAPDLGPAPLQSQMPNPPPPFGGVNLLEPIRRLFNDFGSRANTQHAVFTAGGLNLVKTAAIIAVNYMRDPVVWNRIRSINFDIRDEPRRLQDFHYQRTGITDYATVRYTQRWVRDWVTNARNDWRDDNDEDVIQFLALISTLLRHAEDLEFNYDELPN
ncbi:hypothetical protein QQZ08_009258 [Neonectria magnoliae]|uniref:Uncharacterized protein n=1 Tax=Neonectria magnoliae TaxID=2732573 RepID=A0ABR1HRB0_9HYPO